MLGSPGGKVTNFVSNASAKNQYNSRTIVERRYSRLQTGSRQSPLLQLAVECFQR